MKKKFLPLLFIGVISMSTFGCNNTSSNNSSTISFSINENIVDGEYTKKEIVYGVIFTGTIKNHKPEGYCSIRYIVDKVSLVGNFTNGETKDANITYQNGESFIGEIYFDYYDFTFERKEGIQHIDDVHMYVGKFKNDLYHDDNAKITTHKYNSLGEIEEYGCEYVTKFVEGSSEGQKATYYMAPYFKEDYGVWYYEDCEIENYEPKYNQTCKVKMKLGNGSFYEGEVNRKIENYTDGTSYSGDFVSDKKQGYGIQTFKDGSKYVGAFYNNSPKEQYGTKYFPSYTNNQEGIHYYYGKMLTSEMHELNVTGYGKVKYGDGSLYYGDLYHPTVNEYYRNGNGIQDFTESFFSGEYCGRFVEDRLYKYIGQFDYLTTGWICGNGIMYYSDPNGVPKGYIEGFFGAWTRLSDWKGNFSVEENVHPDFRNLKRLDYLPNETYAASYEKKYQNKETTDILFIGDSYFDMWQSSFGIAGANSYEKLTANLDTINVGIGGTTSGQWSESFFNRLTKNLTSVNKIVMHLGFNDSHIGLGIEDTIASIANLTKLINEKYPNAEIYVLTIEPSPTFAYLWQKDKQINIGIRELCEKTSYLNLIDTGNAFYSGNDSSPALSQYFIYDNVHLNEDGYELWTNLIFDAIK